MVIITNTPYYTTISKFNLENKKTKIRNGLVHLL